MIRDQSGADDARESVSVFGSLLLLPIQTPTASAGRLLSFGGARKPYAWVSRLSFVVPVLYAAGRRVRPSYTAHSPQKGLTLGFVLPARMSVMIYAAWGLTTSCGWAVGIDGSG